MKMKIGPLNGVTFGFSILSLSLLFVATCSAEPSGKRGCLAYGHSCLGGHGKRSASDEHTRLKEIAVDSAGNNELTRHSSINDAMATLSGNEIRTLRDIMKCRNCAVKSSRRANSDRNYIPLLRQMLISHRRPYRTDLASNYE